MFSPVIHAALVRQQGGDDLADVVAVAQAPERGALDERGDDLGEALERRRRR